MSDLQQVLDAFLTPSTAGTAAIRLGWSLRVVSGLVRQLEARGLLIAAEPGVGDCNTGCGACSMQNFCPKSETSPQTEDTVNSVWRLTDKGLNLAKQAQTGT